VKTEKVLGKDFYPELQNQKRRFTTDWITVIGMLGIPEATITCFMQKLKSKIND
jgi:hypothetical protein